MLFRSAAAGAGVVFEGEAVAVPTAKGDVAAGARAVACAEEFFAGEAVVAPIVKEGDVAGGGGGGAVVFEVEVVVEPNEKGADGG